jgi:hypothetical protein
MFTIIGLILLCGVAAAQQAAPPPDIAAALDSAKTNRPNIERVLQRYLASSDLYTYKAARFLIANMEGHCYATYALRDTLDNEVAWDIFDYDGYGPMFTAWAKLDSIHGPLDFGKKDLVNDLEVISDTFLIENIDYAFKAWHEKPWAKSLSFANFCEYVLPYRGSNEPLESWRKPLYEKYANLQSQMTDTTDPIEAARLINKDVMTWFGFDSIYYFHPTDQGYAEMLRHGKGRCEDMTNMAIYAMRANGLAVTSDYTPFWADAGNNHAWNSIVTARGDVIPFMGAEAAPGEYHLFHKLAKAYRKTYSKQLDNLVFQTKKQAKIPGWLAGKNFVDVTSAYVDVACPTIRISATIPDSVDIAYICVFNSGQWEAIQWGRIYDSLVTFTAMGMDIAYMPAFYLNEEIVSCGAPFILDKNGLTKELVADTTQKISARLVSTSAISGQQAADDSLKTYLTAGHTYELFYWQNGWKSLGKATAESKPLVFENVPSSGLYWLVADGSSKEERIFTIENGKQVWW